MEAPPPAWIAKHRPQLRLSLRITLAAVASFALGHALGLAQSYWAVFTAIIVMQASVGGSLKATFERFVGTLGGSAWGVAVSLIVPHSSPAWLGVALAAAVAPLSLLAAIKPAYRVAPVTAVILLLTPNSQATGPLLSAFDRLLEIGLGSVVALVVALGVLPARAHTALAAAAGRALEAMAELVPVLMRGVAEPLDVMTMTALRDRIRLAIGAAETAADEADRERRSHLTEAPDPEPLVRTLRRLHNDMAMIGRDDSRPFPEAAATALGPAAVAAGAEVAAFLTAAATSIATRARPPSLEGVTLAGAAYAEQVAAMRREGLTRPLADEAVARIFGLAFALDQLRQNLEDLVEHAAELARPPTA